MADQLATPMSLIELANSPEISRSRDLTRTASSLDVDHLLAMYQALLAAAPRRHDRDKKYFVGHSGVPSTEGSSGRLEEHLAIALCNDSPDLTPPQSDGLRLLDYQVPLKAKQSDAGVGKVDILALTTSGHVAVLELKVKTATSKGDTPLRALLESLAYCAIIEANTQDISDEIKESFGVRSVTGRPTLVIAGPTSYWSSWTDTVLTGVYELADRIARTFEMEIWILDLGKITAKIGTGGQRPQLIGDVSTTVLHWAQHAR